MAEHQSDTRNKITIPRGAVFKVKGTTQGCVEKRELIAYNSTSVAERIVVSEHDTTKKIEILLSGDCLMDSRESFISLQLATNKYTAYLSSDISSIVRRLVISLPQNQNQVLEDIDNYSVLQSMLHFANGGEDAYQANWVSGMSSLAGFNQSAGARSARRFLNIPDEIGGVRTFCFSLNLSGILSNSTYVPLLLLGGLKVTLYLNPAEDVLNYDPAKEDTWATVMDNVDLSLGKTYATMTDPEKLHVHNGIMRFTGKPAPNRAEPVSYTVIAPKFEVMTIWFSTAYVDSLINAFESANGVTFHYDSFRSQTIVPESANVNFCFPDGLQNLKSMILGCQLRDRGTSDHFNYTYNALKAFCFRVGSRIYQRVENEHPATALVSTLISLGKFGRYHDSSLTFTTYPRSKNVHCFDFQNARVDSDTAHSGLNTTNGRNLRVELSFHTAGDNSVVSPADANLKLVTFTNTVSYRDVHLNTFMEYSKFLRVNNQGILVSE